MAQLMLWRRGGKLVFLLDGLDVEPGDRLELRLPGGDWASGHFTWDGDAYRSPTMSLVVDGTEVTVRLPADAEVRRPRAAARRARRAERPSLVAAASDPQA